MSAYSKNLQNLTSIKLMLMNIVITADNMPIMYGRLCEENGNNIVQCLC